MTDAEEVSVLRGGEQLTAVIHRPTGGGEVVSHLHIPAVTSRQKVYECIVRVRV